MVVTPFVGVWIETPKYPWCKTFRWSHPSWVCGLKLHIDLIYNLDESHTLRGCVDWNRQGRFSSCAKVVTPFVGVWIETEVCCITLRVPTGHTLRGCVDWNTSRLRIQLRWWVTPFVGVWIETYLIKASSKFCQSHPSWVCGLKQSRKTDSGWLRCHTLRGCVDWNIL